MHKPDKEFLHIIDSTPLVSIDLIVKNRNSQVFLGKRNNRPAQHFWFVPGGRIRRNETLDQADEIVIDDQHPSTQWMNIDELLASPEVHENTKAYFRQVFH